MSDERWAGTWVELVAVVITPLFDFSPKTTNNLADFLCLSHQLVELRLAEIANINGEVELRAHFSARGFGNIEEGMKLSWTTTLIALSNVGHDRNNRPLNLTGKAVIFGKRTPLCNFVNITCQDTSLLPSDQILKAPDCSHKHSSSLIAHPSSLRSISFQIISYRQWSAKCKLVSEMRSSWLCISSLGFGWPGSARSGQKP